MFSKRGGFHYPGIRQKPFTNTAGCRFQYQIGSKKSRRNGLWRIWILIDFINMNPEHTELLGRQLRQLCEQDPLPMSFVDFTGLGLAELTRKKTGKPLEEWWKPLDSKLTE